MRLLSYQSDRGARAGVLRDGHVVDAGDALGDAASSVRGILDAGLLGDLAEVEGTGVELTSLDLLAPVPDPEKIICIGLNYIDHAAEARQEAPPVPTFFAKFRNALVPDGATVALPAASEKVDYEAEIAFVVGRTTKEIDAAEALDYIAGYTLLNDLSARDLQFQTPQWIPGKVFDGSAPCGPALVTTDEIEGGPGSLAIALDLNGERMQEASTAELIFSIPELLAHLSTLMTLVPGDIISTGTPAGVGGARDPRVWLQPGDELVVSSPQLGELRTTIAA